MKEIIAWVLGSSALSAAVSGFFTLLLRRREQDDAIQLLLYHDIKTECIDYINCGTISTDALEVLMKMHEIYHKRGGNGYLDRLIRDVAALPLTD